MCSEVGVALAFGVWVDREGATAAVECYAAYLLEFSLSVDNIFVFVWFPNCIFLPTSKDECLAGASPARSF